MVTQTMTLMLNDDNVTLVVIFYVAAYGARL